MRLSVSVPSTLPSTGSDKEGGTPTDAQPAGVGAGTEKTVGSIRKTSIALLLCLCVSHSRLATQQNSLEGEIEKLEKVIGKMEGHLASLQPSLEEVRRATLPLQEALHLPLDRLREEQEMATLLPL